MAGNTALGKFTPPGIIGNAIANQLKDQPPPNYSDAPAPPDMKDEKSALNEKIRTEQLRAGRKQGRASTLLSDQSASIGPQSSARTLLGQ